MILKNKPMRKFHFNAAPQDKAAYVMPRGIVGQFAAATEGGPYRVFGSERVSSAKPVNRNLTQRLRVSTDIQRRRNFGPLPFSGAQNLSDSPKPTAVQQNEIRGNQNRPDDKRVE